MKILLRFTASALALFLVACSASHPAPEKRTIVVSPYSSLSDDELNAQYLALLLELQQLNDEMDRANKARDFEAVHSGAQSGLDKARTARRIARHIDDEGVRDTRLVAIDKIISDLDKLVEITR